MKLIIEDEIKSALNEHRAVVALETTIITHGLPYPRNYETGCLLEQAIRSEGAVPATIGMVEGNFKIGFSPAALEKLAKDCGEKIQARNLPLAIAQKLTGGTTVSATMRLARLAGIRVFATGGIGGVHRQAEMTFDISEDLTELAQTGVAVVSAGAKAILDLPRTVERLETLGVLTVGYQCAEFPAFYTRRSGLPIPALKNADEAAALLHAVWQEMGRETGVLICNPPPADKELAPEYVEELITKALQAAAAAQVRGKDITPFLLDFLEKVSGGRTVQTNVALVENNARIAARIAQAYAALA